MSGSRRPSRRERFRPVELLGLAAVLALFVGLGVLFSTRDVLLAAEFFGVGFIVSLVVLAMLMLVVRTPAPPDDDAGSGPERDGPDPRS